VSPPDMVLAGFLTAGQPPPARWPGRRSCLPAGDFNPEGKLDLRPPSFPPPALPGFLGTSDPLRHPFGPSSVPTMLEARPPAFRASPNYSDRLPCMPCSIPRWTEKVRALVSSLSTRPSPFHRRVGIHDYTFEACSSFTRVTACKVAHPPCVGFVTRLHHNRLPTCDAR